MNGDAPVFERVNCCTVMDSMRWEHIQELHVACGCWRSPQLIDVRESGVSVYPTSATSVPWDYQTFNAPFSQHASLYCLHYQSNLLAPVSLDFLGRNLARVYYVITAEAMCKRL